MKAPELQRVGRHTAHGLMTEYASLHPGVHFLETEALFLKAGVIEFIDQGKLLYLDDDHLSVDGSLKLVPILREAVRKLAGAPAPKAP